METSRTNEEERERERLIKTPGRPDGRRSPVIMPSSPSSPSSSPSSSFLSKISVEPVAFLFILTIYIEYTAVQDVIYIKECHSLYSNYSSNDITFLCLKSSNVNSSSNSSISIDKNEISRLTALEMKYYMAIFSICALIVSLWAGSWSDHFGRRPLLILPSLLGIGAEVAFIFASYFMDNLDLKYLVYVAAVFNGVSGGSTTVISSCFGYVADITSTEERSTRITFLESALFVGGFIGYNIAGLLIKYVIGSSYYTIFLGCAVLHGVIIAYVVLFVKETRTGQRSQGLGSWYSFNHVRKMFQVIFTSRPSRKVLILLCIASMVSSVTLSVQLTLTYVFVKRSPLNWDTYLYSLYNSMNFLASGIALIVVLPLIYTKFGPKDSLFSSLGFASKAVGLCNFGLSVTTGQTFATVGLLSLSEFTMPTIRSLVSKLVSSDERAKAYSFLGSLQNLIGLIGSLIFPTIFALTADFFPGLVFQLAAVLQTLAAALLLFIHFKLDVGSICSKTDIE